ncbi:MAG TPA: molybdenum cofactor guanylyltransferase [Myxococcota bacterium]|nr:molybdenum cofactor guanylyltransferase [Myxococcota bacterium]
MSAAGRAEAEGGCAVRGGAEPAEGRFADVAGAVLVGGTSTRMGTDKSRLELGGVPLAVRTARILASLCEDVIWVGGAPPAGAPGRAAPDPPGTASSLRGLVGALEAARAPRVLVVATDLPGLSAELLLALVALPEADVALPETDAGPEPLCALYAREIVLPLARERLAAERLALRDLLASLRTSALAGDALRAFDPEGAVLANANTPADWARAQARAGLGER